MKTSLARCCFVVAALAFVSWGAVAKPVSAQIYNDPQQRFSIQPAAGWTTRANSDGSAGVTIARGPGAYLQVVVEKGAHADDLLNQISGKSQKQFPGYGISKKDTGTLAGQTTKKIFAVASPPNGAAVVNIQTFAAAGYTYCALYTAAGDNLADSQIYADTDIEESMLKTLRVGASAPPPSAPAAASAAQPPSAEPPGSGDIYNDPRQRFAIAVQPGWMAKSFDSGGASGVTLVDGATAYLQVLLQNGVSPAAFLKSLNDNMEKQLPGYRVTDHGTHTASGQPGSFIAGAGDGDGSHTLVYLETFAARGYTYALVTTSKGGSATDQRMLGDFNLAREMIKTLTLGTSTAAGKSGDHNPPGYDLKAENHKAGWQPVASLDGPSSAAPAAADAATGWATHNDPSGFVVNLPAGWTAARDSSTGSIAISGKRGERTVIWPMFLERQQLDARGAAALLHQLARKVDGQMPWTSTAPSGNVVRLTAKGPQRSAAAMLSWANINGGASVYMYCVEAPAELYRGSEDTFVGILKSFHIVPDASSSLKNGGPPASASALNFVAWSDPHEGAFSTVVPQGWRIIGGAYRLSATDVRYALNLAAPDGQLRASIGDSNIGLFTQPSAMLARGGLGEGGTYQLGDGTKLQIRRYTSGQQFVRSYVETFVRRQCGDLVISSNNARADLAATFSQMARNDGITGTQLTAGDVSFTCTLNGNPVQGKYVAATTPLGPNQPMWAIYRLYGYLTPAARQQEAEAVLTRAIQSWKYNPQWEAQQRGAANAALQQDNMRSQQIRSRALAAIAEDQRATTETITQGYADRQKVYDEISRKRENSILGTMDVIDPETGTRYKVSNFGDYHYMSNDGYIFSTNSAYTPGPDLREMITLP